MSSGDGPFGCHTPRMLCFPEVWRRCTEQPQAAAGRFPRRPFLTKWYTITLVTRHFALRVRAQLHANISSSRAEELPLKIDAALSFAELGERADPLVKPILLYYACAHLCGVYSRSKDPNHEPSILRQLRSKAGPELSSYSIRSCLVPVFSSSSGQALGILFEFHTTAMHSCLFFAESPSVIDQKIDYR